MASSKPIPILQTWSREQLSAAVLLILYAVGLVGVTVPLHSDFMLLTPLNLLTTFMVACYAQRNWTRGLMIALALCFVFGVSIEIVGTQTGVLFGEYAYGVTLGPKILGTPWVMGINWAILVYAVVSMTNHWLGKNRWLLKAILGATLMVALDVIIEPVAVAYDFWQWGAEPINFLIVAPIQNYFMWWIAAFFLNLAFHWLAPNTKNRIIELLFGLQAVFFIWILIVVL